MTDFLRKKWGKLTAWQRLAALAAGLTLVLGIFVTSLPAAPGDGDNDGMPDDWEIEHGLDPERDDSGEDPDSDGFANLTEFIFNLESTEF